MKSAQSKLYVNLNAIRQNYDTLRAHCPRAKVAACVKADAYGLGALRVAKALTDLGCRHFFVSSSHEGIALRRILDESNEIFVLSGVFEDDLETCRENTLIPVLNHLPQVLLWQTHARGQSQQLPCAIHVDTGMNRLGVSEKDMETLVSHLDFPWLKILYVLSHLSCAEDPQSPSNEKQLEKFRGVTNTYFPRIKRSFANSGGIFLGAPYHFDMVRAGAALYGIEPSMDLGQGRLRTVATWLAPIIQIHHLEKNQSVGYGNLYVHRDEKPARIATIPLGYADGLSTLLTLDRKVYVNGHAAPILGRVSMDLTVIDVTHVPEKDVYLGEQVEIIGDTSHLEDVAKSAQTHGYEVLATIGSRVKRVYV